MSENWLLRLADELAAELHDFLTIRVEIKEAQSRITTQEPDSFELRAIGSILHDVYQNAENILQRIAKAIDQKQPVGEEWHRALLSQMTKPLTKTRPEVIQPETSTLLDEYRKFRHIFRNIYGFRLDWTQMKPLLDNAEYTIDLFATDIERFIAFLRMMGQDCANE